MLKEFVLFLLPSSVVGLPIFRPFSCALLIRITRTGCSVVVGRRCGHHIAIGRIIYMDDNWMLSSVRWRKLAWRRHPWILLLFSFSIGNGGVDNSPSHLCNSRTWSLENIINRC